MKRILTAVRDIKTEVYLPVMEYANAEDCKRNMAQAINDPRAQMIYHYPEDYEIYHIANWNNSSGDIEPLIEAVLICNCKELKVEDTKNIVPLQKEEKVNNG